MEKKPLVIVTGGSSGLGKSVGNEFLKRNKNICLISRNETKLLNVKEEFENKYPNSRILIQVGNISDEIFVKQVYTFISEKNYYPQYLINCAGVGEFGKAEVTSKGMIEKVFEGNLVGLILMCTGALPYMKSNRLGYIINIMSTAALYGKENETVYCAAKWGARGYTESLKKDLITSPIQVVGVYPGGMRTNFWEGKTYCKDKVINFMDPDKVAQLLVQKIVNEENFTDIILERKK